MSQSVELNPGEIKINFSSPTPGRVSFSELGLTDNDVALEGGLLRLVFDFEGIGEHHYYKTPTVEVAYKEMMGATHWQCDFNEETIADKIDHHGRSTVILMDRKKLSSLEHRHKNTLVVHAEFPDFVHLDCGNSYINFFN